MRAIKIRKHKHLTRSRDRHLKLLSISRSGGIRKYDKTIAYSTSLIPFAEEVLLVFYQKQGPNDIAKLLKMINGVCDQSTMV